MDAYHSLPEELADLIRMYPPPFLYINDPISLRTTVDAVVASMKSQPHIRFARVDAIECFSARLLFDGILNALVDWQMRWENGPTNWGSKRYNTNLDTFLEGLCTLNDSENTSVIIVEHPERLSDLVLVPLTRLAELAKMDISVIFVSEIRWLDIRPSLGASPEPYFFDIPVISKEKVTQQLVTAFSGPPHLKTMYGQFVSVLCDVCYPFTNDLGELAYIAAARWPGFVKPILENPNSELDDHTRLRYLKFFNPTIIEALGELYPRKTNALQWVQNNDLDEDGFEQSIDPLSLPRMSKLILIASYIASYNPPKMDLRMFGRGRDEKKRKQKRNNNSSRRTKVQVPQQFIGPGVFPLDRMIAILGTLLEDNEGKPGEEIPGERTDMEITRIGVYASIAELSSVKLLYRTTPLDRIDGPLLYKCGVPYEVALAFSRDLDVPLNDLLWDPK